jgi:hypothetical protein
LRQTGKTDGLAQPLFRTSCIKAQCRFVPEAKSPHAPRYFLQRELVELRGFEPLTPASKFRALDGAATSGSAGAKCRRCAPLDPALDRHHFTCPALHQRLEGLVGLDENRWVVDVRLSAASKHRIRRHFDDALRQRNFMHESRLPQLV